MEGGWDQSQSVQLWSPPVGTGALVRASEGGSEVQTACGGDAYQTVIRPSFSSSPAGLPLSSKWLRWPWPELNVAVHLKNLPGASNYSQTCMLPVSCVLFQGDGGDIAVVMHYGRNLRAVNFCLFVGPDICGFDIKTVHVILHFKNQYHANKKSIRCKVNAFLLNWWLC